MLFLFLLPVLRISIHAPREGGDHHMARRDADHQHFNPRPPRGGRQQHTSATSRPSAVQSTPPARGATARSGLDPTLDGHFNPRPPRGGRPKVFANQQKFLDISIHAPREGGDFFEGRGVDDRGNISIHAPREGGDWWPIDGYDPASDISIHAPREGGDVLLLSLG